jgi:hypothetical protein
MQSVAVNGCGKDARFTAEGDVGFSKRILKPFMELGLRQSWCAGFARSLHTDVTSRTSETFTLTM